MLVLRLDAKYFSCEGSGDANEQLSLGETFRLRLRRLILRLPVRRPLLDLRWLCPGGKVEALLVDDPLLSAVDCMVTAQNRKSRDNVRQNVNRFWPGAKHQTESRTLTERRCQVPGS